MQNKPYAGSALEAFNKKQQGKVYRSYPKRNLCKQCGTVAHLEKVEGEYVIKCTSESCGHINKPTVIWEPRTPLRENFHDEDKRLMESLLMKAMDET